MSLTLPNELAAPNLAIALQLHVRRYWREVGEQERSPIENLYC